MLSTQLLAHQDQWDGPGPWWPLIPLFWIAFFVVMGVVFVRGSRRRWDRHGRCTGEARLAERFAAGEIDAAEYRDRKAVLREERAR